MVMLFLSYKTIFVRPPLDHPCTNQDLGLQKRLIPRSIAKRVYNKPLSKPSNVWTLVDCYKLKTKIDFSMKPTIWLIAIYNVFRFFRYFKHSK